MSKKLIISILCAIGLYIGCRWYLADVYYKSSRGYLTHKDQALAYSYAKRSVELNPYEPAYKLQLFRTNPVDISVVKEAIAQNPNNLATLRNAIPLFAVAGTKEALPFYTSLKETYPTDLGLLVQIAKYERELGMVNSYASTKAMVAKLRPDILEWHENFN